jgi:hypothetical protein
VRTGHESVRKLQTPCRMVLMGTKRRTARGSCPFRSISGRRLGIFRDVMLLGICKGRKRL